MNILVGLTLLMLALVNTGCSIMPRAVESQPGWIRNAENRALFRYLNDDWRQNPPYVHVVQESAQVAARARLKAVSAIPLNDQEARLLSAPLNRPDAKLHPYLVRACRAGGNNHGFTVLTKGDQVLIKHGILARRQVKLEDMAVVAWLPAQPSEVYVECSVIGE